MKRRYGPREAEETTTNEVTALLRFIAPRARKTLASKGANRAAWEAVREAESIINGNGRPPDRGDRFVSPGLDRPGKVERLRLLVRVLTRYAA